MTRLQTQSMLSYRCKRRAPGDDADIMSSVE
ncbi:hypothetical protein QF019_003044 [Pseudomonas frederiksbergensis]